jgi:signal transduction histidine kinase
MRHDRRTYLAWVRDELLLVSLLGAALALFLVTPSLRVTHELPELRLVLDTAVILVALVVSVLAYVRFSVEKRRFDLFLASSFAAAAASTLAFTVGPTLGGGTLGLTETWAGILARLFVALLLAIAPFVRGRTGGRQALASVVSVGVVLAVVWMSCRSVGERLPDLLSSSLFTAALALQALLSLVTLVGFGLRYRARGEDLDRWLALGATLGLFAELHAVFTPPTSSDYVSQADFLRLLSYGILLVGVWGAIRAAEFGRAVSEERARVAREIHDGLAQYLFAITAHTSRLEKGAAVDEVLPKLKEVTAAAQQEARFAVLALASAGGTSPFGAALRRYIEFLTGTGGLEVDLDIERGVELGPDEQIEVFRIVQEGLANVRRHANARRAIVRIGMRDGQRVVTISDDGVGISDEAEDKGQGLKNMRTRAASIGGAFRLLTRPGGGTALEVTLRA